MTWFLDTGAAMAAAGLVGGLAVPALIACIPEPGPDADEVDAAVDAAGDGKGDGKGDGAVDGSVDAGGGEPKELYVSVAATPRLGVWSALTAAVAGGLVGARLGWGWELLVWVYLVPVGVALAVVDWRTRLLPTKVIAPSYAVVVALTVLAGLLGDRADLVRAGWGWLVAGGTFFLLWLVYPRGMGYGDVRLSGLLGIALGYLGWGPLVVGVYAGFLLGAVGGALLSGLRVVDRKAYPFGPFMLLGALVGVLTGNWFADLYTG